MLILQSFLPIQTIGELEISDFLSTPVIQIACYVVLMAVSLAMGT
jgi:hypothetical protein